MFEDPGEFEEFESKIFLSSLGYKIVQPSLNSKNKLGLSTIEDPQCSVSVQPSRDHHRQAEETWSANLRMGYRVYQGQTQKW